MKEEKKTSGNAKKNYNKSNHKPNGNKNHNRNMNQNNRPQVKRQNYEDEAPKVREIKEVEAINSEDEDKKLVVLIAIAVLIIIGTVIGLLVGLNKEGDPEDNSTNETNITVPVSDGKDVIEDSNKEDEYEYVVKTTSSTTTNKYQISYYLNGKKVYSTKIKEGAKIKKFVPSGYTNCSYYSDSEHSNSFNFSEKANDDANVYLVCSVKEYTVTYKDYDGTVLSEKTVTGSETESYKVENYPYAVSGFLGWSKDGSNKIFAKYGKKVNLKGNLTLTAVFGDATVVYTNQIVNEKEDGSYEVNKEATKAIDNPSENDEIITDVTAEESVIDSEDEKVNSVEVGIMDVESYSLPSTPSEIGLDTPTYFVPTDASDANGRLIVSDDAEDVTDKQIKLGEVKGRTPEWYTPVVDDNVKEKDYEFAGYDKDPAWKPKEDEENEVKVNWKVQEEDKKAPAEAPASEETNNSDVILE